MFTWPALAKNHNKALSARRVDCRDGRGHTSRPLQRLRPEAVQSQLVFTFIVILTFTLRSSLVYIVPCHVLLNLQPLRLSQGRYCQQQFACLALTTTPTAKTTCARLHLRHPQHAHARSALRSLPACLVFVGLALCRCGAPRPSTTYGSCVAGPCLHHLGNQRDRRRNHNHPRLLPTHLACVHDITGLLYIAIARQRPACYTRLHQRQHQHDPHGQVRRLAQGAY
jgi:hypothetical protein